MNGSPTTACSGLASLAANAPGWAARNVGYTTNTVP